MAIETASLVSKITNYRIYYCLNWNILYEESPAVTELQK